MAKAVAEVRISLADVMPVIAVVKAAQEFTHLAVEASQTEYITKLRAVRTAVVAYEAWAQE